MQTATLTWHGPYSFDRILNYDIAYNKGIYAISRIWGGKETLLYIGSTKRTLYQRIYEHSWWFPDIRGKIRIRFGILDLSEGQRFSLRKLKDIEALLIAWHRPCENTMNYHYYYGRFYLTVINKGRRGVVIAKEVSTEDLEWVK